MMHRTHAGTNGGRLMFDDATRGTDAYAQRARHAIDDARAYVVRAIDDEVQRVGVHHGGHRTYACTHDVECVAHGVLRTLRDARDTLDATHDALHVAR